MFNKILKNAILGLGIGFIITNIILFLSTINYNGEFSVPDLVSVYILWSISSLISGISLTIYELEKIPLLYKTFIHTLIMSVTIFTSIMTMFNKIYSLNVKMLELLPSFFLIFTIAYFIIWTCSYLVIKNSNKKLNQKLKNY